MAESLMQFAVPGSPNKFLPAKGVDNGDGTASLVISSAFTAATPSAGALTTACTLGPPVSGITATSAVQIDVEGFGSVSAIVTANTNVTGAFLWSPDGTNWYPIEGKTGGGVKATGFATGVNGAWIIPCAGCKKIAVAASVIGANPTATVSLLPTAWSQSVGNATEDTLAAAKWATYNATPATRTEGQTGVLQATQLGDLKIAESYSPAYEDTTGLGVAWMHQKPLAAATNALTAGPVVAGNSIIAKASAGRLYHFEVYFATSGFLQVHNSTTLPANTTVPLWSKPMAAGETYSFDLPTGWYLSTGIVLAKSSTNATLTISTSSDSSFLPFVG